MSMSVEEKSDGFFIVGCQSTTSTTTLAVGSTAAQILAAYQALAPFSECQSDLQSQLDTLLNGNFDLLAFIRAGSSTTVTANGVGTFLSTICNNYRSLRASIAAATNLTQLNAININSGWPSNP